MFSFDQEYCRVHKDLIDTPVHVHIVIFNHSLSILAIRIGSCLHMCTWGKYSLYFAMQ